MTTSITAQVYEALGKVDGIFSVHYKDPHIDNIYKAVTRLKEQGYLIERTKDANGVATWITKDYIPGVPQIVRKPRKNKGKQTALRGAVSAPPAPAYPSLSASLRVVTLGETAEGGIALGLKDESGKVWIAQLDGGGE